MPDPRYGMGTGRIRTVKPELGQHEDLFDLEQELGVPVRFAWVMMFCQCDREGRFPWRPRTLKARCLPFDDCDFSRVLDAWWTRGFVVRYRAPDGSEYGCIPTFPKHQHINPRERDSELPNPADCVVISTASTRGARVVHASQTEGKGREGKGREELDPPVAPQGAPPAGAGGDDTKPSKSSRKQNTAKHPDADMVIDGVNELNLIVDYDKNLRLRWSAPHKWLHARLNEGYKVADLVLVVEYKVAEWGHSPRMRGFLQQSTLFAQKHWPDYLDQARSWVAAGRPYLDPRIDDVNAPWRAKGLDR